MPQDGVLVVLKQTLGLPEAFPDFGLRGGRDRPARGGSVRFAVGTGDTRGSYIMIEMIGYLGSALVVASMLMSSVVKLRVINTIGSGIFAAYALIIHSYPTALMNVCLVGINIYNLVKLNRKDQSYDLVEGAQGEALLRYLLDYYGKDIRTYFPGFSPDSGADRAYIVCCGGTPAGVLLGRDSGQGTLQVLLDYSTPTYRDCSIGAYLYARLPSKGFRTLVFTGEETPAHAAYLTKMGFVKRDGAYVKELG